MTTNRGQTNGCGCITTLFLLPVIVCVLVYLMLFLYGVVKTLIEGF